MSWPLSHEFNEAIQNPQLAFADPDLKAAEAVVGAQGLPLPRSGNFADVYQMRGADGREWAVKCFTRPVVGLADRYARISEALVRADLPFAIGFSFLSEGIRVGGVWRPVVKMEWVEGLLLNQVVRENAGKPAVLSALGQMWSRLCKRLRDAGIAHADIQHGNVLLVPGSRPGAYGLKLIDYDGMYVPALANTPSGEAGHPSFQHPARASGRAYSPDVDRFPHLAVATALKGLATGGSALWERYDNGDNLLFAEDDYRKPSASKAMRELWQTESPAVQALVGRLAIACGKPIPQTPWLDQLAPDGEPALLDDAGRREAAAALGIALPVPVTPGQGPGSKFGYAAGAPPVPVPLPPEPGAPVPAPIPPTPFGGGVAPGVAVPPGPYPLPTPPGMSAPSPQPANPFEAIDVDDAVHADEADVELVDEPKPAKKKLKRRLEEEEAKGSRTAIFLLAGAGLLLLVGGVVAGVALLGGKKSTETVQQEPEDSKPKPPAPKPPAKAPPGTEDPKKDPVVPLVETPAVTPALSAGNPVGRLGVKERWTVPIRPDHHAIRLVCSADSSAVTVADLTESAPAKVLDAATGKPLVGETPDIRPTERFHALEGRKMAVLSLDASDIAVLDAKTGDWSKVSAPLVDTKGMVSKALSPNSQYVAVGAASTLEPAPFKLAHAKDGKVILDLKWVRGLVHFTGDSSRVLVAEGNGQCRWYKLPSGEPDGEWKFDRVQIPGPAGSGLGLFAISSDGSVGLYDGRLADRQGEFHLIEGRTGRVLRSFAGNYAPQFGSLSADGRLAVLPKRDGADMRSADVIETATGRVALHLVVAPPGKFLVPTILPDGSGVLVLTARGESEVLRRYDLVPAADAPSPESAGQAAKLRHKLELDFIPYAVKYAEDGKSIVAHDYQKKSLAVVDVRTGEVRNLPVKSNLHQPSVVPLPGEKIGIWEFGAKALAVLDLKSGESVGALALPEFPAALKNPFPGEIKVSPDERFVAVGMQAPVTINQDTKEVTYHSAPVRVWDDKAKKNVVEADWRGVGRIFFDADSSRVLVVDGFLQARWYKLPSGELDKEWAFKFQAGNAPRFQLRGASRDGRVLLCVGSLDGRYGYFLVDGETGEVTKKFEGVWHQAGLSADAKRVVLVRHRGQDSEQDIFAFDLPGGAEVARVTVAAPKTYSPFVALAPDGRSIAVGTILQVAPTSIFDLPGADAGVAVTPPPPPPQDPPIAAGVKPLKQRWSVEVKAKVASGKPYFDNDGQTVALVGAGSPWGIAAFSASTGEPLHEFDNLRSNFWRLFPMEKGKIGYQNTSDKEIMVCDPATGRLSKKLIHPPTGAGSGVLFVDASPNGRYMAVGHPRSRPGAKEHPLTQLRIIDTLNGLFVVTTDWHVGATAFTADSSRVLVVDDTDRFRWYKLPSGKLDGGWSFDRPANGSNARLMDISADGGVILYHGQPPGKGRSAHILNGKDGSVLHSFPARRYLNSGGAVSEDGKFVALIRNDGVGTGHTLEVLDIQGKLVAAAKIPKDAEGTAVAVSWKGGAVVMYERGSMKLTAYDLPANPAP